jgi:hypothetical protein
MYIGSYCSKGDEDIVQQHQKGAKLQNNTESRRAELTLLTQLN